MKIRNGFVSNSSSSSFIVATNGNTKIKISYEVDLAKIGKVLSTEREVIKEFKDWCYDNESEIMIKALKAVREGKKVIIGSFSNEGSDVEGEVFLCDHGIPKDVEGIEIIKNEAGY